MASLYRFQPVSLNWISKFSLSLCVVVYKRFPVETKRIRCWKGEKWEMFPLPRTRLPHPFLRNRLVAKRLRRLVSGVIWCLHKTVPLSSDNYCPDFSEARKWKEVEVDRFNSAHRIWRNNAKNVDRKRAEFNILYYDLIVSLRIRYRSGSAQSKRKKKQSTVTAQLPKKKGECSQYAQLQVTSALCRLFNFLRNPLWRKWSKSPQNAERWGLA